MRASLCEGGLPGRGSWGSGGVLRSKGGSILKKKIKRRPSPSLALAHWPASNADEGLRELPAPVTLLPSCPPARRLNSIAHVPVILSSPVPRRLAVTILRGHDSFPLPSLRGVQLSASPLCKRYLQTRLSQLS